MDPFWKEVIWQQFGATIDMLDNAILACPSEVWDKPGEPKFWYIVYHTLFFLDFYLSDSPVGFTPPAPFDLAELDPAGVMPARTFTTEEMRGYLEHGRRKCRLTIAGMTEEKARERCGFEWVNGSVAELLLYSMRHVQHHSAQLNLMLRQDGITPPRWVRRTNIAVND